METPIVLDGEFLRYEKTKAGFTVSFTVSADQQKELRAIAAMEDEPLSIVIVTAQELEALNGDLH